jgi:hypothetical protein
MVNTKKQLPPSNILTYKIKGASQGTIRRHYYKWRSTQDPPLPERCDNPNCFFSTNPLIWNNEPIKLILDHINGNHSDNRPENLRLLCPNCNSQLKTHGGGNKGKVRMSEGGFAIRTDDEKWNYVLPAETGHYSLSSPSSSNNVSVIKSRKKKPSK